MKRTILKYRIKQSWFNSTSHETLGISYKKLLDIFGVDEAILDDNKDGLIYDFVWKSAKNKGEPSVRQMRLFKAVSNKMIRLTYKDKASEDFRSLVRNGILKEVDSVYIDIVQQDNGEKVYYFDYIMPTNVIVFEIGDQGWIRYSDRYSPYAFNDLLNTELQVFNTHKDKREVIKIETKADKYIISIPKKNKWQVATEYKCIELEVTKAGIILRNRNRNEVQFECINTELSLLEE